MGLIGNSFVIAGLILTLLVGAVAWVVTRQVVKPVRVPARSPSGCRRASSTSGCRRAARTTSPCSATSFNGMADSLQPQIRQLEELSRGAAAVRLRRVARAAHPADDDPDGRRRAARGARRTSSPTVGRSAELLQASSTGSRRCSPTCSRSAGSTPARPTSTPSRSTCAAPSPRSSRRPGRSPSAAAASSRCTPPTSRPRPRSTRAGSSGSCATWSSTPSSTARGGRSTSTSPSETTPSRSVVEDHGVGPAPGRGGQRLQPVLARRPGPGPHHRRHRSGAVDLARGRPAAQRLAAGLGRARRGLAVPAHPAAARRRHPARVAAAAQPDGGPVTGRRARAALGVLARARCWPGAAACRTAARSSRGSTSPAATPRACGCSSPARPPGSTRSASCAASCGPGRRATRPVRQRPGLPHGPDEREVEPRPHPRAARRRRGTQGDAARPRDGAHHRSRGRHGRPRGPLHRGPRGQHGHRDLRPVDGGR